MRSSIDYIIVGGGIAGLRAAITLAPAGRVLILTKASATESNTGYAQGGIAAAVGDGDTPALHAADSLGAGDGLCDEVAVRVLVEEGPAYVRELIDWGAEFDRDPNGALALGLEAAHSVRRVLHAGDATGREIGRALAAHLTSVAAVEVVNHALVTDLIVEEGAVAGVRFFDLDGTRHAVRARSTLLATGGAGQVFSETTNPAVATGDGVALAYHAGARLADLEFVQFHPTALDVPGKQRFLISEALRGEGARLVNAHGEPFMHRYHAGGDLAPRDVVARSIVRESQRTAGQVSLILAHLDAERIRRRFPNIAEMCRQIGLDLASDPIPVGPAAHYLMGGIETDQWGRSSIPGLYAAGETACTGVHGANRLASNSLLEGLVFGARAATAMMEASHGGRPLREGWKKGRLLSVPACRDGAPLNIEAVREVMWNGVGLFRTRRRLEEIVPMLDAAYAAECAAVAGSPAAGADLWRRFNLMTVAHLIARAALRREESRGGHFREDFPVRDDQHWKFHVIDERDPDRTIE